MRKLIIVLALILSFSTFIFATEDLILTTPETKPPITKWRVQSMLLNWSASQVDVIFLDPDNGRTVTCSETRSTARTLMSTLNTANLTANSLHQRVFKWAIDKGCLTAGTISGTP